jgi:hypothetical protein
MNDSMTERARTDRSAACDCDQTGKQPGTAGTAKPGVATGRSLSLMRKRQRGGLFVLLPPFRGPTLFLSLLSLLSF